LLELILIGTALLGVTVGAIVTALVLKQKQKPPAIHLDLGSINSDIRQLPTKILQVVQGSTANIKGAVAEHISYLNLASKYDRLIPLGSTVDFIGINFDSSRAEEDGRVDFIDIKTGKYSRLTQEQAKLKRLILGGRVAFLKVKVSTDCEAPHED